METYNILTLKQVCELLRLGRLTVLSQISKGKIKGVKIGGQWRFNKKDILDLLK